jgi:alkylation response protein AidB-like acyl-CoA dehydrogenase
MKAQELLGRVRDLKPAISKRAAECERLRRLPDETFRDFQEAGLFRWFQPRSFGGDEGDPLPFYQAQMEVGEVCGSSASLASSVYTSGRWGSSPKRLVARCGATTVPRRSPLASLLREKSIALPAAIG